LSKSANAKIVFCLRQKTLFGSINMHLTLILGVIVVILFLLALKKNELKEGMGGYGIISGLGFNSKSLYCFKNPHDPPDFPGYCSVIGKVVV
jgi:hypothetical protein